MKYTREQATAVFWSKVQVGEPDECWPWKGCSNRLGYGFFGWEGKIALAHRLAFFLSGAFLAEGLCVCHACDNPICCNPGHLFAGTKRQNSQDAVCKERMARGEKHGQSKLTESDILRLRNDRMDGMTYDQLSHNYGVSVSAVYCAVNRITWRHVQ
jgi:HNH endonuclease